MNDTQKEKVLFLEFSLLDRGRKYTGNHRKYIVENAREICYSPETREKIRQHEALGYYGHGIRQYSGEMDPGEMSIARMPNGQQAIISNVPSNLTLEFDVDKDGTVRHTQKILDSEPGRIVWGLHSSGVGGFSWACSGSEGSGNKPAVITGFSGFDYVLQPGFSANRGYLLESANTSAANILESVTACLEDRDEKRAEKLLNGWQLTAEKDNERIRNSLMDAEFLNSSLRAQNKSLHVQIDGLTGTVKGLQESINSTQAALDEQKNRFSCVLKGISESLPFFIPESVMHEMLEGDFARAKGIFESARFIDYSQYPLAGSDDRSGLTVGKTGSYKPKEEPEFGTAAHGWSLDI